MREQLGAARGVRCGPRALGELLEALEVRGDASQRVAGATGLDRVGAQGLPQRRDVGLEDLGRARRRRVAPELVDERVGGNHAARVEQQSRQQGARLPARNLDRAFERPQQPELDHACSIIAACRSAATT